MDFLAEGFRRAWGLLVAGDSEVYGIALLTLKVAVVATAVAGIPEVVEDGRTGLLVPPADADALGAALARLFGDAALRERLGRQARLSVLPRFGIDRYVESVVELYGTLLAKRTA